MSSLVFPYHDLKGEVFKYLKQVLPILKDNFDKAFVSVTPKSAIENPESVEYFQNDNFFKVNFNKADSMMGEHFVTAFASALENSKPEDVLHLCTADRLCFAILNHKEEFLNDIKTTNLPTLFERSAKAWSTHPQNYYAAESMVTEAGKILFGEDLDFAWCHLTLTAGQLQKIMPLLTAKDLVVFAQVMLNLRDIIVTKEVDWLSWEDPFIFGKEAGVFKREREIDVNEVDKRMGYVTPMIKYLFEEYRKLV